jgi:hypothetical protein
MQRQRPNGAERDDAEILMKMKQEMDQKKSDLAVLQGKREAHYQRLKEEFDCDTIEDADQKIAAMDKDLDASKQQLNERIQALRERYEWDFDHE